jgi:hypothetical protein
MIMRKILAVLAAAGMAILRAISKIWSPAALHAYSVTVFWTVWIVLLAVTFAYFVPWFVSWRRHLPNTGSVFVVNLLAGWTLIGYVVAFAMAVRTRAPAVVQS